MYTCLLNTTVDTDSLVLVSHSAFIVMKEKQERIRGCQGALEMSECVKDVTVPDSFRQLCKCAVYME